MLFAQKKKLNDENVSVFILNRNRTTQHLQKCKPFASALRSIPPLYVWCMYIIYKNISYRFIFYTFIKYKNSWEKRERSTKFRLNYIFTKISNYTDKMVKSIIDEHLNLVCIQNISLYIHTYDDEGYTSRKMKKTRHHQAGGFFTHVYIRS